MSCTATDAAGNSTDSSFTVTVKDTTAPLFGATPNIGPIEGNTLGGATVFYAVPTATDAVDGDPVVTCSPAPGSKFLIATTTVTCHASDESGNTSTRSFTVKVVDTTPPKLTVPTSVTTGATTATGATVTYSTSAVDIVDGPVVPVCAPASGTAFDFGATTVTCTAKDSRGNTATASFVVTVRVDWSYEGFDKHIEMGKRDKYGLNTVVNKVSANRVVTFRWSVEDERTDRELKDPSQVEMVFMTYAEFRVMFNTLPGRQPLPNSNVCSGRTTTNTATNNGNSTDIKITGGDFNVGIRVPSKPTSGWNCYVGWTRVIGDPSPGIVSLFTLT